MRIILIHIIVALLLGFWSNSAVAQEGDFRSLESFNSILLKGNWDIILEQGTEPSIRMAAKDPNKLDKVEVSVKNDRLSLIYNAIPGKEWKDHPRIKVYLIYTELEEIDVEGKMVVESRSTIQTENFDLDVEGYLKGEMDVIAKTCNVDVEGYFRLELRGETQDFDLDMEGFGKVWASKLKSQSAKVSIEGMASAYVYANESLFARVEGMAKLGYAGDPQDKKIIREGLTLVSKK